MKCDDICFTHVLPRLNRTDLKFLYEVNTETRKLIKRSSRAGDLRKRFNVEEMSSISTLEVAWEHFPWGTWGRYGVRMDERHFCNRVAQTNKLELLKWAREEKKCRWNERPIEVAAYQGNLEMVKYCVANECPIDVLACARAAKNGHLECLKYLREEVKAPSVFDKWACKLAAENGHLDCLKYLHETAKAPWDYRAVQVAHLNDHPDCLQYLLDNDCPLPSGWSYKDGKLYTSR